MPLYYFDIDDGERLIQDSEGHDCNDRPSIKRAAVEVLPEIAGDILPDGDQRTFSVYVRDSHQRAVFQARLIFSCAWLDKS